MNPSPNVLIGHPTFSRSVESHSSAHSADTNFHGWRRGGTIGSEDVATQTEVAAGAAGSVSSGGRTLLGDLKRRRDDTIVDISLESMKYNGGMSVAPQRTRALANERSNRVLSACNGLSTALCAARRERRKEIDN